MAWEVNESTEPHSRGQTSAKRTYNVIWTPDDENDTDTSPQIARTQVEAYLSDIAENYSAQGVPLGTFVDLDGAAPTATQRRLISFLHGFPADDLDVDEVEGSLGRHYKAVATWGTNSLTTNSDASSDTLNNLTDSDEGKAAISHNVSAGLTGDSFDYAPVRALFGYAGESGVAQWESPDNILDTLSGELKWPVFPPGTLNAQQATPGGRVEFKPINFQPPPVDHTLSIELSGGAPKSLWVKQMADAANRGTLNTDTFSLAGLAYLPGELLYSQFNIDTSLGGTTRMDFGFSSREVIELEVRESVVTIPGSDPAEKYKYSGLARWLGPSDTEAGTYTEYWWMQPSVPITFTIDPDDDEGTDNDYEAAYISGFDFVWTYKEPYLEGNVMRYSVPYVSVHVMFAETSFTNLFGVNSL